MINTTPLRKKLLDLAVTGKLVPKTGEWKTVKLGDIAEVQLGKMLDRGKNVGTPYKYLANINVRWGTFDLSDLKETLFTPGDVEKFKLIPGDLLMCEGGVPGRCAIWRETNSLIKYQKAVHRIRPSALVTSEYLQLYFEAIHDKPSFVKKFTGSTIHHLPREVLICVPIPLPPLAEQKAIVKRLEELLVLEREIAADSAAIDDLIAAAKRKILVLAVSGKLVKKRGEWLNARLGDLCEYGKCISVAPDSLDDNTWVLDLEDIEKDTGRLLVRVSAKDRKSTSTKHGFKKGTLLYSKLRTYLNKVLIAPEDGCCTSEILPLVFDDRVDSAYARIVLMSPMFLDYTATCCYGVKMPRLGTNDGKRGPFPLPPLEEQRAIVAKVDELFAVLDAMKSESAN